MQLQGKVAVVTGAGTGIGSAIARCMASEGAAVVVNYIGNSANADAVVAAITGQGGTALAVSADISNTEQVAALFDQAVKRFGRVDILVNNAGIEEKHPFLETPWQVWEKIIAVNLSGPWICSQAAAQQMVRQGNGGRIINISSVHEDLPMLTNAPYCASKGGLRMLMRTIAVELAPYGITVNNIGPGAIDTPMDAALKANQSEMHTLLAEIPLGRMGRPEEIGGLAVFLASDAAAYVTGSTYFMDGGMLRMAGSL